MVERRHSLSVAELQARRRVVGQRQVHTEVVLLVLLLRHTWVVPQQDRTGVVPPEFHRESQLVPDVDTQRTDTGWLLAPDQAEHLGRPGKASHIAEDHATLCLTFKDRDITC